MKFFTRTAKARSIYVFLLLLALAVYVLPQQPGPVTRSRRVTPPTSDQDKKSPPTVPQQNEQDQDKEALSLGVTNIVLPVTVIDQKERFVDNLKRSDFVVLEDNHQQQIVDFKVSTRVPTDIAVMIDLSSSVKGKLDFEKAAAKQFLQELLQQSQDRVLLTSFNDQINLEQDYTRDANQLFTAINRLNAQGRTRLYDAVYQVTQEKAGSDPGRRTAIVLITDGADTASSRTFQQTVALAQQKQIVIYGLSTQFLGFDVNMDKRENQDYLNRGEKELRELCAQTGGKLFFPKDNLDVQRLFTQIGEELRSQYIIVYAPSNGNGDGHFRAIEVRLTGKLGERPWQVRTRRGYVAAKDSRAAD